MSWNNISVDIDAVTAALARLAELHDDPAFPTGADMARVEGAGVWPTAPFQSAMFQAAQRLGTRVTTTRGLLAESHEQLAQAVKELVAIDTSLADDGVAILSVLDSVPTPGSGTNNGTEVGTVARRADS